MALEIMKENVQIIQSLSDYPNQEEGLTAGEMKAKFDEAAVRLKKYLNDLVVPEINGKLSGDELNKAVSDAVELAFQSFDPAKIGAAPAGYGINNDFKTVATTAALDSYFTCGWVRFINTATDDLLMGYRTAIIRVDSFSNSTGNELLFQTAYLFSGAEQSVGKIQRFCTKGSWQPWEWIDPPMELGTEYRTTQRHNGKCVYAMRIDCGAMPNKSSKTISYAVPSGKVSGVLSCVGHTSQGDPLPYVTSSSNYQIAGTPGSVIITTNLDKTTTTATATIRYWKSVD